MGTELAEEEEGDLGIMSFTLECNRPLPQHSCTVCLFLTRPPSPGWEAREAGDEGRREDVSAPEAVSGVGRMGLEL